MWFSQKVLVDAVDSLDLVDLPRSTLRRNVSSFAVLTVEETVADLAELNWQECCVTSLEKLSSSNDNHSFFFPASSSDHHSLQLANHSQSQSQTQFAPKRRIDGTCDGLIPEAFCGSLRAAKMVPRRKRSGVHAPPDAVYAASTTVDSASLASCWIGDLSVTCFLCFQSCSSMNEMQVCLPMHCTI